MIDPLSECDEEAAPAAGEPRIGGDDASGMRAIEAGELEGRYVAASSFRVKPEGHVNYEELTELAHARYRILRDLRRKDTFLVLPERYSITRIEADEPRAYEGAIHCCSTQESNFSEGGSFRLTARVMPTLTRVERYQMMERLRRVAHPQPKIEYPSEVECGVTCHFRAPGSDPKALVYGARATRDGAGFRVTLTTSAAEAKPLQDQLTSAGIFVDMHFEMEDRTILVSQIEIHPKKSIGPWLCGPLEERREGDSVVLTKRIDQPLWIWEVLVGYPHHHDQDLRGG